MNEPPPLPADSYPPVEPRPRSVRVPTVPAVLTYGLLGQTVLAYAGQFISGVVLGADIVLALGAKVNPRIVQGEWWRLITPVFVHAGLLHIAFNMYALYAIGPQVEGPFGHARFVFIYLFSGVVGVLFSFVMSPERSVGASGAIFGLVGALGVYLYRHRRAFGEIGRQRLMNIVSIVGINLVIGLTPGIDNWGHLGGLVGGVSAAGLLGPRLGVLEDSLFGMPRVGDRMSPVSQALIAFALCLLLAAGAFLVIRARG